MHEGTILKIIEDRGFGFIGEPGQPDCFFNINDCIDLEWGEQLVGLRVRFRIIGTDKGPKAVEVRVAE